MPEIVIKCPAKINLGLEILERGPDGYHGLRTVFQTIALYDELRIRVDAGSGVEIECNVPELATESNLVVRAAKKVLEHTGLRKRVRLALTKNIPAGGGLGGGSSDAAGVLRALPRLLRRPLALEQALAIAAELGADVPFFLLGGRAVGLGIGAELYPLPDVPARPLVVVHPGVHVSTAEAYRKLDEARKGDAQTLTTQAIEHKMFSFCASVIWRRWDRLGNDFEPVVFSAYPELARLKGYLIRAGASPALLSGSGSAMFGMFDSGAAARLAAARIRARWHGWRVWVTRTVRRERSAEY